MNNLAVRSAMKCVSGVTAPGSTYSHGPRPFPTEEQTSVFQFNKEAQATLEHQRSKSPEPPAGVIE